LFALVVELIWAGVSTERGFSGSEIGAGAIAPFPLVLPLEHPNDKANNDDATVATNIARKDTLVRFMIALSKTDGLCEFPFERRVKLLEWISAAGWVRGEESPVERFTGLQ
jgi:hypothetical protein